YAISKTPGQLSGGMRRRVSLARALVSKPRVVLLDDTTSGLEPVASRVIMGLIVELHHEYRATMILVSQDLRRLLPVVDRVLALFDGEIAFNGSMEELRSSSLDHILHFISCRYDLTNQAA